MTAVYGLYGITLDKLLLPMRLTSVARSVLSVREMLSCCYYRVSVFRLFVGSDTMSSEAPCLRGERQGVLAGLFCRLREVASEPLKIKKGPHFYHSNNTVIYTALAFKLKRMSQNQHLGPSSPPQKITDL